MSESRPRVRIVVDEMVLRGVPPEQADAVLAAFEEQLTRLAADGAAGLRSDATTHVVRPPEVREPVEAAGLGRLAATSAWRGIVGEGGGGR